MTEWRLQPKTNVQTFDPTANDDETDGYDIRSIWLNYASGVSWHCVSPAAGAAVWVPNVGAGMLLGRIIGANMNSTGDQPFALTDWSTLNPFRITKITAKNASVSLTTAAGGIYPAASKGGTAIVAASQAYTSLTASEIALDLTLAAGTTVYPSGIAPILSLTTPQGAPAAVDFYLYGDPYV